VGACEPVTFATKHPSLAGKTQLVGLDPTNPPVAYRDATNPDTIRGFDPDFLGAVASCMGLKYEIHPSQFSGLIGELLADRIDVVWSDLYSTPDRAKVVDVVTYLTASAGALVNQGNPKSIKSMDDLRGVEAAADLGTVEDGALRDQSAKCTAAGKPAVQITTYSDSPAIARAVQTGRSDVALFTLLAVDGFARDNPHTERAFVIVSGIKVGVGVGKDNPELTQAIFEAIQILQADGTEREILQKNGMDPGSGTPTTG
jgi:polar amino acid transport system substrate-binding protein